MRVGFRLLGSVCLAAALTSAPAARASSYSVIYTAPVGQIFHPAIGAVRNGLIYGTDPGAGAAGAGIVFTMSTSGQNYATLYTFSGPDGATPNARLAVLSGHVYGTTQNGGTGSNVYGTAFSISSLGTLTWSYPMAENQGSSPMDGLAQQSENYLYGTTSNGAIAPGDGILFRIGRAGHLQTRYRFKSRNDGHCPYTGVVIDARGNIFGTTVGMGFGGRPKGSIWEMQPGQVPTTVYAFRGGDDGEYPMITPTLDGSGNLWGVTGNGGAPNGAIWELSGTSFKVWHSFTGGADGFDPNGPLLLGKDGNLYGTTLGGGLGLGTLFRITPQGHFSTVHQFHGGADGAVPTGSLALAVSGRIFGGTQAGTIFQFTP